MNKDTEQYIQFLKNMVKFYKVFGGNTVEDEAYITSLEQEIKLEEEREMNSVVGRQGHDENYEEAV